MEKSFSISGKARVYLGEGGNDDFDCPIIESGESLIKNVEGIDALCVELGRICKKYRIDPSDFGDEVGSTIDLVLESETTTVYLEVRVSDGSKFTKVELKKIKSLF